MIRRVALPLLLLGLVVGLTPAGAGPASERLRALDAEITAVVIDKQGVRTELTGFGPLFGPHFLSAYLGDAQVQIPYSKIRSFRVGELVDQFAPVDILMNDGSTVRVRLEAVDVSTMLAGNASFGYFKIKIGKIASCTMQAPERGDGLGRRCPTGHLFYNNAWRFCPYDGKPLRPIVSDEEVDEQR